MAGRNRALIMPIGASRAGTPTGFMNTGPTPSSATGSRAEAADPAMVTIPIAHATGTQLGESTRPVGNRSGIHPRGIDMVGTNAHAESQATQTAPGRGHPEMVAARFLASFATAVIVGLIWARKAAPHWMRDPEPEHDHGNRVDAFVSTVTTDFVQAGGFLVIGAALVATLQTLVPQTFLDRLGGSGLAAVLTMAVLAVVLSVCSEADAFIAAGLTQFSLTSRLVFLVVGPMVDLKLVALQVAIFGRQFAARFAPLTFAVAVVAGSVVGWFLL